jgi:DNA-binding NtrC family response regulator
MERRPDRARHAPTQMTKPAAKRTLLSIIELGGYPNFTPVYERAGYRVETASSVRKAMALLKKIQPEVVVAEFNFQSDFRDRTSSLESLLAVVQRMPDAKVIVFYEQEHAHQLAKLQAHFPFHETLAYPIDPLKLEESLQRLAAG